MRKKLLSKHCALLLLALAAAWSTQAWAITINVNVTGNQAPYVYAWDNNQNPLIGAFPGTQLTNIKKVGNKTWYYIDIDATSVNVILSFGTDATKTGDIAVNGNRYFEFANNYANNVTDYYDCPGGFEFESSPFVYLVDTKNWANAYAYVWNGNQNNSWPGDKMEYLGTNGNGNKVYKWSNANINFTPANIKFNNVADNGSTVYEEGNNLNWTNGAFWSNYNWSYAMTVTGTVLNSTNFPDANLRKAITASTGIAENGVVTANNVKVLDISYDANNGMTGKITNPTGIELFTELEELYSHNNSLTHLDLTHTSSLRILDVSGDDVLLGMRGTSYCNPSGHGVNVKGNNNFKKLIANDCSAWAYNAGLGTNNSNYQYITSLEYISEKNCPLDGWSTGFDFQTGLKYLDISNTGQKTTNGVPTVDVTHLTQLETLIVANNYKSGAHLGSVKGLEGLNNLKYFDISGCDGNPHAIVATFTNTQKGVLEYLDISNQHMTTTGADPALDGFTALKTFKHNTQATWTKGLSVNNCSALEVVDVTGNEAMTGLTINNCPSLQEVIVTSNTSLPLLSITNSSLTTLPTITGLTTATALHKIDLTGNAFTAVPAVEATNVTTMVMNSNLLTDIVAPGNINYLYAQNNNFGSGDYTLPTTSLVGLDLGNNGFTKFKAENNTSLKSLALAGNTDLVEIELHGNTALTQTSPDGVIESDNGLYIKGLSNLQTLNIENSKFNKLGQQNSLEGVTGLTKLQARNNEFTTFTNGVYALDIAGNANYRMPDPSESSLEHLTALEYLDLAYNNLQDSVHLYKNVALKHLDVSHNNEIHGVIDGTINPNDATAVEAMIIKKGKNFMKYGRVYGRDPNSPNASPTPGWNPSADEWNTGYTNLQAGRERPFDLRIEDLNDTTGLYHLDLGKNVNLEWLDISYTNIHNTSAGPTHMNPGWMDKDWVTDMGTFEGKPSWNTTTHRAYVSWHSFVYFIPCSNLKVIHADHNNMRSLGVRYFPELDTLTCSYMYGDSEIMRDFNGSGDLRYGMGNTGTQTAIKKFHHVDWNNLDSDGYPTIVLWGPNNSTATSDIYPSKLRYWDLSYSGYNEVRLYPGTSFTDLPYLEYVDVSGNPLNFTTHASNANYATTSNYNSLDVTYCPNIRTVKAENCSDLPIVRAHNRSKLDTLYLSNDPNLKTLYVQNDPILKTNFQGLNTLTGLETLFGYNNTQWGNDISFSNNTALKNLWISNIGASSINVANNANLEKLRAYDNSLTTIDLSNSGELLWLDVARNKLPNIDLSGNTKLQFFNISNGSDTRTELDGTELLNHDGSDGDDIYPTTVYSDSEKPIESADDGNSLSDLVLPASIIDARANGNDLHSITGNFANLTNMEFAHNHVNGIDLSAAPNATVDSRDNGRAIVADFATFKVKDNNNQVQEYKFYFFQLENPDEPNGTILTDKESHDLKTNSRHLGDDGLALNKISSWNSENSGMLKSGTTVTPSNMGDILDPDQIPGNIVVLVPNDVNESTNEASGHATYNYTTGAGAEDSEFYLDWTSNGTVTGINIVDMPLDEVTIANSQGNLVINGADGTAVGVYDLNGRQIASETINGGSVTISGLTPGIYIVNGQKVLVK